jgi:hypothetical protein
VQTLQRVTRLADGGPHDAAAAEPAFQVVPEHRVVAEDPGQGPERNAEAAQEQGPLDVGGARRQLGHQERGPDAVGGPVLQDDPPDSDSLFGRRAGVLQLIAVVEIGREQLGHLSELVNDCAPELRRVVGDLPVGFFRDGQAGGTMPARRSRRL